MENGVVNTTAISGRVKVLEVENSYRGMMSVIGRMEPALRCVVCGTWDAPEDDGGIHFDEYCTWCGVFRSHGFKPSMPFLEVDGKICMRTMRDNSTQFVYYKSYYDRMVNVFDYCSMQTYDGLSNQEMSDLVEFLIGWSSMLCGPSILLKDDVEWLFGEAGAEERARVARTLPCSDGLSHYQVDYEEVVSQLARDGSPLVRAALMVNEHMSSPWITMGLHTDRDWRVRRAVAGNGIADSGLLMALARDRDWRVRIVAYDAAWREGISFLIGQACSDEEDDVRIFAHALMNAHVFGVTPRESVHDRNPVVRALHALQCPVGMMDDILEDPCDDVQMYLIANPCVGPDEMQAIAERSSSEHVRAEALMWLASYEPPADKVKW